MRRILCCGLFILLIAVSSSGKTIRHYVFFGMDREKLKDAAAFLELKDFEGAQIAYSWRQLEPGKDEYDFSLIREDLAFLSSKGKKLFVQIQDVSFSEKWIHVPRYLLRDPVYGGGADKQYHYKFVDHRETDVKVMGWMARRWDENVRARFKKLLLELGKEFDGKIEGVNLAETAYDIGDTGALFPKGFTFEKYRDGIIANMQSLKEAFPKSAVLVYANFMPGEWLPNEDKGYLRAVYEAARRLKVGVGGPDLLPYKQSQMNNSYPLIRTASAHVPVGLAVQDGDYSHVNPRTKKEVTIAEIIDFGKEYLGVDYIFWCTEEPFYSERLVAFIKARKQEAVCRGKSLPVKVLDVGGPTPAEPRMISLLKVGISKRSRLVIRERDQFNELWDQIAGSRSDTTPAPQVDFSREMLIVAAMGERPTGGYEIVIKSACEVGKQIEVHVLNADYVKCGGASFQVITAPVDIVRIPKSELPVVFRETEFPSDCKELSRP